MKAISLDAVPFPPLEQLVNRPKILLVDDVDFFLEMEKDFLRNTPATILTAQNGKEALEIAASQRPNVIFMDVAMPVMDGIACCRALKADPELKSIPVVMVFAPSREGDLEAVTAAGSDGILIKPVIRNDFLDMGRRFLFQIERREKRVPCQILATLRPQGKEFHCVSEDLSEGGMYIKSREPMTMGEVVRISMVLPGGNATVLECTARVSWINQGFPRPSLDLPQGFGLQFVQPSLALLAPIRTFLNREKTV